jgi:outer membrane protein OmpA-like peptidoglycan-associated protein
MMNTTYSYLWRLISTLALVALLLTQGGCSTLKDMVKKVSESLPDVDVTKVEETERGLVLTFDNELLFKFDSDEILPEQKDNLDKIAEFLEKKSERDVSIEGHADSTGEDDYNLDLSERRAKAVRSALIERGIPESRIEAVGFGETRPVVSNETADGQRRNRRVEVIILKMD